MKRLELNSLREESPPSPTKLLMKHIVAREPELTMKFFLGALANIKRFDVINELKKFFVGKNILVNFRINHNSCLKWQFTSNLWLIRQNPNSALAIGACNQQFLNKTWSIYNHQNKERGHSDWIRSAEVVIVKDCFFKKTYIRGSWKWQENSKNSPCIWSYIKSYIFFSYFSQRYRWPVKRVKKTSHNKITSLSFICFNLNQDRKVIWLCSSMAVDKLTHWKSNCVLPYQKSRGMSKWENDNINKSTPQKLNCASMYWKSKGRSN